MEKNENSVKRMIFQPTKENEEKLRYICETSGLSLSIILNLILNEIDKDMKVVIFHKNEEVDTEEKNE